jgi:iron complex outermembrane receptor protein
MRKIGLILFILSTAVFSFGQDTIKESSVPSIEVVGIRASSKTPVTQKKITAQEISKSYQGQEMTYILSNTPSVNFSSDGGHAQGYTYFRMRGMDQTRVNMTLNGVPLNEPEDQGVYFSNLDGEVFIPTEEEVLSVSYVSYETKNAVTLSNDTIISLNQL